MAKELKVSRGKSDPRAKLAARVAKDFGNAAKRKAALELTVAPPPTGVEEWEIFAFGPYQTPQAMPGRIIKVGETAYIAIVVWMNDAMMRNITGWGANIELNIFTSDMQRMSAVTGLDHYCCIQTVSGHCWYVYVWEFTPPQEACLYETNICARACNCYDEVNPEYAGFVRHVYDFDSEKLWPPIPATIELPEDFPVDEWPSPPEVPPSWGFDRPIRYMVYDPESSCDCGDPDAADNNFCDPVISGPAED